MPFVLHVLDKARMFRPGLKSVPMVSFRERGKKKSYDAEFATATDAQIFVDRHKDQPLLNSKGNPIPGKVVRGAWEWFVQYFVWREEKQEKKAPEADLTATVEG